MKFGTFLFLATIPGMASGAQIVKFGAKLCDDGSQLSSGTCMEKERGACPAGYYVTPINSATYARVTLKNQCMNSYNKTELPAIFHPIYNGVLIKFGATLCGGGQQFAAGQCQDKVQGRCPAGFYKTPIAQSTFSSPSAQLQECMNSYNQYELAEYLSAIYNGVLVLFGAKLCGAGQYLADGECTSYDRGECPAGFYQATPDADTLTTPEMGVCATGYSSYALHANCDAGEVSNGLCAVLCTGGLRYTGLGTCATLCPYGGGHLKTSAGVSWPMYSEKLITPSLGMRTADGSCYINFLPGAGAGINIKSADAKTYHITD